MARLAFSVRVLKDSGVQAAANELGRIVIKLPLPPGTLTTLYRNDALFKKIYFSGYPGYYDTMDVGYIDSNGYVTVLSRADDVINVAGHRISAGAIEEAVLECVDLAECAVVALRDDLKGW
jgi:propionyl-CoA synthetase